ncbi:hypothetical protein ABIE18_000102 [Arthrobacter sp. 2762]
MKHVIKVPSTAREFGNLADQLEMGFAELLDLFDKALGSHWWNDDHEELTIEVRDLGATPEEDSRPGLAAATWPDKWFLTVREGAELAYGLGVTLTDLMAELEKRLGPIPMPPAGFSPDPHSDTRWLGPESTHRKWIITPVWNAATDTHSFDVRLADHQAPNYAALSASDALELTEALAAIAATTHTKGATDA